MTSIEKISRAIGILALLLIAYTIAMFNVSWILNVLNIIITLNVLAAYTNFHFNGKRMNLFRHEQGYKMTKTQERIVDILEYKLPLIFAKIAITFMVIIIWAFRIFLVLGFIYFIYYLYTH